MYIVKNLHLFQVRTIRGFNKICCCDKIEASIKFQYLFMYVYGVETRIEVYREYTYKMAFATRTAVVY